jgi:hypothetical protein
VRNGKPTVEYHLRLQAVAGDEDHREFIGPYCTTLSQLFQNCNGHAAGRLSQNTFRFRQQLNALDHLVVRSYGCCPVAVANRPQCIWSVGRNANSEGLGNRVRDDGLNLIGAVCERVGDRRATLWLSARHPRVHVIYEANAFHLVEPLLDFYQQ